MSLPWIQATEVFINSNFSSVCKTLLSVLLDFWFLNRIFDIIKFDIDPWTKMIIDKNLKQNILIKNETRPNWSLECTYAEKLSTLLMSAIKHLNIHYNIFFYFNKF